MDSKTEMTPEKQEYWKKRSIDTAESITKHVKYHMDDVLNMTLFADIQSQKLRDIAGRIHGEFTTLLVELHKIKIGEKQNEENNGNNKVADASIPK